MKILIIHASAGAGHQKAAEALFNVLKKSPYYSPTLIDALDYTHPFYKYIYRNTYTFLITKIPWIWQIMFSLLDVPFLQTLIRFFRRCQNHLNSRSLERFLIKEKFDWIISAHFFPNEVSAALKRKGNISSKIIGVITDYDVHRIWLAEGIDMYALACDWTKKKIKNLGIPEEKTMVTGIPIDEKFAILHDKQKLKQKLGIEDNIFTVLVATGSFGIGPIEAIIDSLKECQAIVICGHNKDLYGRLKKKAKPYVKVNGLVNNMDEWMSISDIMITKPGGLSITEAMACQLPMIFFNAIPGQETNNIKVLKEYGIGLYPKNLNDIIK